MHEWTQVIAAVRQLLAHIEDPSAAADYGTRYGLVLLGMGQSGEVTLREGDLLILDGEAWLGGSERAEPEIKARLVAQLRRYTAFSDLPAAIGTHLEQLVRELSRETSG